MHLDHLFSGSALAAVDRAGRIRLPRFVREVAERRSGDRTLVLGPHDSDPCLTGYDRAYRRIVHADTERRRLLEEAPAGESPRHASRARRAFGLTEEAGYGEDGTIALPPMARALGKIDGLALFVGTGGAFEIWNPQLAADGGDPDLAALARWRLGHDLSNSQEEE